MIRTVSTLLRITVEITVILLGAAAALAQGTYEVPVYDLASSGQFDLSGGAYTISGSIGQFGPGSAAANAYTLTGGFWAGVGVPCGAPSETPVLSVGKSGSDALLDWPPVAGATTYDVVGGSILSLRSTGGDFTASSDSCIANGTISNSATATDQPGPGEFRWYLVRPRACSEGTFDSLGAQQVGSRDAEIDASGVCP
jgi:hypothetical protein